MFGITFSEKKKQEFFCRDKNDGWTSPFTYGKQDSFSGSKE